MTTTQLIKARPAVGWVRADAVPKDADAKELLKLHSQIEELKEQLKKARSDGPAGTEHLSQGEEEYKFSYSFAYLKFHTWYSAKGEMELSWNTIFYVLAPHMVDEISETKMKDVLDVVIRNIERKKAEERFTDVSEVRSFTILDGYFQSIKIQLRSLGLIIKSDKKRAIKDTATYWTLTPYGDNIMTNLRAIKKAELEE